MKADIEKLKSSLAEMKANIFTTREPNELARWRNNVDMWDTVLAQMEHMQKHIEAMGPGMMRGPGVMMHGHDMGGQPASPPPDKKPQ